MKIDQHTGTNHRLSVCFITRIQEPNGSEKSVAECVTNQCVGCSNGGTGDCKSLALRQVGSIPTRRTNNLPF